MNTYHVIEILIVGGAVALSSWSLAKRFIPQLRGKNAPTKAGGCASCNACGACDTPRSSTGDREQPVHLHRS